MKIYRAVIVMMVAFSFANAQEKIAHYFPGAGDPTGKADVGTLIGNFIQPLGLDISVLPNNGWFNTARTHKRWGFDLSVSVNSVFVTAEDKSFTFPSGISALTYLGTDQTSFPNTNPVPTVYGSESVHPIFEIISGPDADAQYKGPDGFDPASTYSISAQPIYTIQGGIGLFKNTDLRFRFAPQTTINSVKVGNWGIGIMHDVLQHITKSAINPFALSIFLGYTKIDGTVDLSGVYTGSGQEAKVSATGFTGQAIISKEFKVLTLYGALGYDVGKTTIDINGTYNVDTYVDANYDYETSLYQPFTLTNPYSYDYQKNGFRFTGGLRLRLGPITLNSDYSFVGDKRVLSLGLGFLTDPKSNQ